MQIEHLEGRLVMSGAPSTLLAQLPAVDENINVQFDQSLEVNGKLFFTGHRSLDHERLYAAVSGNATPTQLLEAVTFTDGQSDIGISGLSNYHSKLYFFANSPQGDGLFVSDGTVAGTKPVKIFRPPANVLPKTTFILNDKLYFFWNQLDTPTTLYSTDGTSAGTKAVWSAPSPLWTAPAANELSASVNGNVFFSVGGQLWKTNGTTAGTKSLWAGTDPNNTLGSFAVAGTKLFFLENGFSSRALYTGNLDGTGMKKVTWPSMENMAVNSTALAVTGSRVLFVARNTSSQVSYIFSTDGTSAGTIQLAGQYVGIYPTEITEPVSADGKRAVFLMTSIEPALTGLWSTDGTAAGTTRLLSQKIDTLGATMKPMLGKVFFVDPSQHTGIRLFKTDGTVAGTSPLQYVQPWVGGLLNPFVGTFAGRVLLPAGDGYHPELWSVDPTMAAGTISGMVYHDWNGDGKRDANEFGISNIVVYNDANNNKVLDPLEAQTVTDLNGNYTFAGVPAGNYKIRAKLVFPNWVQTTPANGFGWTLMLVAGAKLTAKDFGQRDPSQPPLDPPMTTIGGVVFNDFDADGVRDSNEPAVVNVTVYLDKNNNGVRDSGETISTTDRNGRYMFFPGAGTYVVRQVLQSGWTQTTPASNAARVVTIVDHQQGVADFGTRRSGAVVSGSMFNDLSADGVKNAFEINVASGWKVYIDLDNDSILDANERFTTTDSLGRWYFDGLAAGTYKIRQVLQTGWRQTTPTNNYGVNATVSGNQAISGKLFGSKQVA
jgi:ELWxxDGT repeat protein